MNSRLVNSTFLHNKEGCPLDVTGTGEGAYMVYFVSFLGTLAVLPGNIVSALLMDKIGRLRMLGEGERLGGVSELMRGRGWREDVSRLLTLVCGRA